MKKIMFTNTTVDILSAWLENYTQHAWMESFPTEKGRYSLQRVRRKYSSSGSICLEMDGDWIVLNKDGQSETLYPVGSLISFELLPLARERLEVRAECTQPVLMPYFNRLLEAIVQRWPEANQVTRQTSPDTPKEPQAIENVQPSRVESLEQLNPRSGRNKQKRLLLLAFMIFTIVSTIVSAALAFVANVAANQLPISLQPYAPLSLPFLPVLAGLSAVVSVILGLIMFAWNKN